MSGYISRSTIHAFVGAALRELGFTKEGGRYKRPVGNWWLVVRIDIDLMCASICAFGLAPSS